MHASRSNQPSTCRASCSVTCKDAQATKVCILGGTKARGRRWRAFCLCMWGTFGDKWVGDGAREGEGGAEDGGAGGRERVSAGVSARALLASANGDGSPARKLASSGHRASEPSSSSSCCTRGALTSGGGGGGIGVGTLGPPEPRAASLLRGSCTPGVQVFRQQRHILASQTEPSHATTSMTLSHILDGA